MKNQLISTYYLWMLLLLGLGSFFSQNAEAQVVANNDTVYINSPGGGTLFPLANDIGDNLYIGEVCDPTYGVVALTPLGALIYTITTGALFNDEFCYIACDAATGICDTATIFILIGGGGSTAPVANDDYVDMIEGTSVSVNVLANDNAMGLPVTISSIVTPPTNGTVAITMGTVTYAPIPGFSGSDFFTYSICNTMGECDEATVYITVLAYEDATIVAVDDFVTVFADEVTPINITNNDTIEFVLTYTYDIVTAPNNGIANVAALGNITYVANPGFVGLDTLVYELCDGFGYTCDQATVIITVLEEPPLPDFEANDDDAVPSFFGPTIIDVLANDLGDALVVTDVCEAMYGIVAIEPSGSVSYTPNSGALLDDEFCYIMCSATTGECDTATVYISTSVDPCEAIFIDFDLGGDVYTCAETAVLDAGIIPDAIYTWSTGEIAPSITVSESGTYFVEVNVLDCSITASVIVFFEECEAVDDLFYTEEDTPIVLTMLANDFVGLGMGVEIISYTNPANGTLTPSPIGTLTYTPVPGFVGTDEFDYIVCTIDMPPVCDTATVTIIVTPFTGGGIIANDDYFSVDGNTITPIDILANDDYTGALTITTSIVDEPENGSVSMTLIGGWSYIPSPGFMGLDSFTYEICSPELGVCDQATVYITVGMCDDGCVWPGDSDNDGEATMYDLLPIGLGFGETGSVRADATLNWTAQPSIDWAQNVTLIDSLTGAAIFDVNGKYVDTDGDGTIGASDTTAVLANFGLSHAKNEGEADEDAPTLTFVLPEIVEENSWVEIDVVLGNIDTPIDAIYGLVFDFEYESAFIVPGSVSVDFNNSWVNDGSNLSLYKELENTGTTAIGQVRTDGSNIGGYGVVATVSLFIIDNIDGKDESGIVFEVSASNATMITNTGAMLDLNVESAATDIATDFGNPIVENTQIELYPNPANQALVIDLQDSQVEHIEFLNIMGQTIHQIIPKNQRTIVELSNWQTGVYMVRMTVGKEQVVKRLVITK